MALQILTVSMAPFPCSFMLPLATCPVVPGWWPLTEESFPAHFLSLALLSRCLHHHHTGRSSPGSHTCAKPIRLSLRPSIPPICPSVHLSVHLSVHASILHPSFIHAFIHPPSIHSDASSIQPRPEFAKAKFNLQLLHQMLVFSVRSLGPLSWTPLRAAGQGLHPCFGLSSASRLL